MISVIIVNYNVKDYLYQSLETLYKSKIDIGYEVLVVNNSKSDNLNSLADKYPNLSVHTFNTNKGFSHAVNYGISKSIGNYYLLLNPDTMIKENMLKVLYNSISNNKNIGIVGCKVLNSDGSFQLSSRRSFPTFLTSFFHITGLSKIFSKIKFFSKYNYTYIDENEKHYVDAVSGACMMFSRDTYEHVGNFDERFFLYFEDTDFCYRAIKKGYNILYNPDTQIIHYKGESVKRSPIDIKDQFYQSMIMFYSKYKGEFYNWTLMSGFLRIGIYIRRFVKYFRSSTPFFISFGFDMASLFSGYILSMIFWYVYMLKANLFVDGGILKQHYLMFLIILFSWIVSSRFTMLYRTNYLSYSRSIVNNIFSFFISSTAIYFISTVAHSRVVLFLSFLISVFISSFWRLAIFLYFKYFNIETKTFKNLTMKNVLIVGNNAHSKNVANYILSKQYLNYNFHGYVYVENNKNNSSLLGSVDDIEHIVNNYSINEIIFCSKNISTTLLVNLFDLFKNKYIEYKMSPHGKNIILTRGHIDKFNSFSLLTLDIPYMNTFNIFIKRVFDIILSLFLIILTLPVQIYHLMFSKLYFRKVKAPYNDLIYYLVIEDSYKRTSNIMILYNILYGNMSFVGSDLIDHDDSTVYALNIKPGLTNIDLYSSANSKSDIFDYMNNYSLLNDIEILIKSIKIK